MRSAGTHHRRSVSASRRRSHRGGPAPHRLGYRTEDLIYYGLEYKFVTQHLLGELTRDELFTALETAIHQFAKRQMTWFRGMERRGFTLHYIDGLLPREEQLSQALEYLEAWEQK